MTIPSVGGVTCWRSGEAMENTAAEVLLSRGTLTGGDWMCSKADGCDFQEADPGQLGNRLRCGC